MGIEAIRGLYIGFIYEMQIGAIVIAKHPGA